MKRKGKKRDKRDHEAESEHIKQNDYYVQKIGETLL